MSQWLQSAKATVSAGASVISFADNQDFSSVRAGDVVMLNGQIWQCASGTRPDSAGQSTVTLAAPWPYTGASNVNAFVFRTTHDLLQLTSDARKLTNITKALLAAQEDILKGTTPTINVPIGLDPETGNEEVITVTPWQYVINVVNASLGNISAIGAMSQVQFEAIRSQNKEKYAASAWVSFGNHEAGKQVNECKPGLYTALTTPNTLLIGKAGGVGGSKTDHGVLCIAGVIFHLPLAYPIRLAQAPDGKTTYNKSTGVITHHATVAAAFNAQAADPVNVEVVINRVDMWGFEAFPQEVTSANPEIYPQGVFSDLFNSMNGIQTSDSALPVSYFGFLGKKAKKVDFFALSDAQKKKVLADPKNNLYYSEDGRLIQWILRGREFAGAGNGDWASVNPASKDAYPAYVACFSGVSRVTIQGRLDTPNSDTNNNLYWGNHQSNPKFQLGVFTASTSSGSSVNNECYFLICGTVNRLNKGAYHPSFNQSGACKYLPNNHWHNTTQSITSSASCFDPSNVYTVDSGFIATNNSGRQDGRFYDSIYASGQGGVCRDMRYSAYDVDSVDFAEADQRVKRGIYRGFERAVFTRVIQTTNVNPSNQFIDFQTSGLGISIGDTIYIEISDGVYRKDKVIAIDANFIKAELGVGIVNCKVVLETKLPYSVGGSFLQIDVIGNPANILATPQLANGWQGSWVTTIPDGVSKPYKYTRTKIAEVSSKGYAIWTLNNGGSWSSGVLTSSGLDGNNSFSENALSSTFVVFIPYQAFAKQTENAVNNVVYGGINGINNYVYMTQLASMFAGILLAESLIGKTLVSASSSGIAEPLVTEFRGLYLGKLSNWTSSDFDNPRHNLPIDFMAPTNNSPAIKTLNYNVNINQQAFIQYAYTELKHNGTNWGDDGKVTIVDNQATKTDLNGNTVLVGTAKLKEPIGWIKNKV